MARRVGISAPSIYGHFADRDAILDAVLRDTFDELTRVVSQAGRVEADPVDRLHAVCRAYVAFAADRPHRYRVLFARHRTTNSPAMTQRHERDELSGAEAFAVLVDAVAAAVAAGRSASADPPGDATALWVALHGYVTLHAGVLAFPWPDGPELLRTLTDRLVRLDG